MLIKLKPHISKENFTGETPSAGMSLIQQGRYSYFYTNTRGDISSSLKHNANSLHSYMYDEYGMLYDNNPQEGGKITLGNMDASNFTQSHNDYTFQQKEYDSESGLNYFGARYLDSFSGTWTTNDIVRGNLVEPMSQHRTTYVHDNPVNLIDRYGYSAVGTNFQDWQSTASNTWNTIQKNFTLPQNLSGKQNYVSAPKTQNQGNTAGTLANQFVLRNVNNQGSVLSKNPLSSNTNWGSQIANTFSSILKTSKINQVVNAFTSPMAERHHRAFALLGLITGTNLQELLPANAKKWLEDWIDGEGEKVEEVELATNANYTTSSGYMVSVNNTGLNSFGQLADSSHSTGYSFIIANGIDTKSSGNCSDRNTSGCTSLEGVRTNTLIGMMDLQSRCGGCLSKTNGVSEAGGNHSEGGFKSHMNGWKGDFTERNNPGLTNYIESNLSRNGNRKDTGGSINPRYNDSLGNVYVYEVLKNHWDITFNAEYTFMGMSN